MRVELAWIEKTEKYLMGTLSAQDKADFERSMDQKNGLKQQVDFQQQLIYGIRYLALKKSAVQAFRTYKFRRLLIAWGFVLVLISALVLGIYFRNVSVHTNQHNSPDIEGSSEAVEFYPESEEGSEQIFQVEDSLAEIDSIVVKNPDLSTENKQSENDLQARSVQVTDENEEGLFLSSDTLSANSYPSGIVAPKSDDQLLHEWVITRNTSEKDLKEIGDEISAAGGSFRLKKMSYKSGYLDKISFTVMNKSGEVYYGTESLGKDGKICVRFGKNTISAGWCGPEEEPLEGRNTDSSIHEMDVSAELANSDLIQLKGLFTSWMLGFESQSDETNRYSSESYREKRPGRRLLREMEAADTLRVEQ